MSGAFGSSRRSRTRSPIDDYAKKSLLAKVGKSELKLLRVAVKRSDVIGGGPQLPLERSIDDPARICAYVHYRKDESKRLQPPIFGRGIKVNQDFTENRRVFTHEKNDRERKSTRKSRSRSTYRSRSPRSRSGSLRNRSRSPRDKGESRRAKSRERGRDERSRRNSVRNSRSRTRSKSKRNKTSGRRESPRRSLSKHRSRSRERRYSLERRKYKDDSHHYSNRRSRHSASPSRSISPHEHEPSCPMFAEGRNHKKSLTPLRPGEYRPGHPDLATRNRSYEDRSRLKRSRSRDDLPSTSRDRSSPGRHAGSSKTSKRYPSPTRTDRSPVKSDRYRRRSRSPFNNHSPTKRSHKGDRRRSRSPQYGDNTHGEYGYYEGWGPGPRFTAGRGGGYPMPPFFAPAFHPRGIIPGPIIPPGHMIVPRMPMMSPYGPYRPHLPIYNSGAVRQKGPRPTIKSSTITSEQGKDGDNGASQVVITEADDQNSEKNEDSGTNNENNDNLTSKNGNQARDSEEGNK